MSSKRALRRAQCGHKVAHASKEAAVKEASRLRWRDSVALANTWKVDAYHCAHCGAWHTGHERAQVHRTRREHFE